MNSNRKYIFHFDRVRGPAGIIDRRAKTFFSRKIMWPKRFIEQNRGQRIFQKKLGGAKAFSDQIFPKTRPKYPVNFDRPFPTDQHSLSLKFQKLMKVVTEHPNLREIKCSNQVCFLLKVVRCLWLICYL